MSTKPALTATFDEDATIFVDELSDEQLQQLRAKRCDHEAKVLQLSKHAMVSRLLQLENVQQRVADALNLRSKSVQTSSGGQFAWLNTSLVVFVAQFLDVPSLCSLARAGRFLRVRLSLSLKGTPSPGMVSVRSLDLRVPPHALWCSSFERLHSVLLRSRNLVCLGFPSRHFLDVPLPASLRRVQLQALGSDDRYLQVLGLCPLLETLDVDHTQDKKHPRPEDGSKPSPDFTDFGAVAWPHLRSLKMRGLNAKRVHWFLESAPALTELAWTTCK